LFLLDNYKLEELRKNIRSAFVYYHCIRKLIEAELVSEGDYQVTLDSIYSELLEYWIDVAKIFNEEVPEKLNSIACLVASPKSGNLLQTVRFFQKLFNETEKEVTKKWESVA
jgi:hypothetical protein